MTGNGPTSACTEDAGSNQSSWDGTPSAESAAKPMSFRLLNEMITTTTSEKSKNATLTSKSDHSPIDVADVDRLPPFSEPPINKQERKSDDSTQLPPNTKKKPNKSKNKSKGLSASLHTPSRTWASTSTSKKEATSLSTPSQPNTTVKAVKKAKAKGLSASMHTPLRTSTSNPKKVTANSSPPQPNSPATAAKEKATTTKSKTGLSKSMHAVAKTATNLSIPTLPLSGGGGKNDNDIGGILKSPGKLLKRVLSSSAHGSHAARKAARNKQIENLQAENEKLLKDRKKLKKLLARKTLALAKLEEAMAMQQYECPSTLYGKSRSSYDVMKEQADLQIEIYEQKLDAKDNQISNLESKNKDQQGRISYLEILCLQNGINIDEKGYDPKDSEINIEKRKDDVKLDATTENDEKECKEEASEGDDEVFDYEIDGDTDDDSDDDSFACASEEDPMEDEEEEVENVLGDDLRIGKEENDGTTKQEIKIDEEIPPSKLDAALGQFKDHNQQGSKELDETSIGITNCSKQQTTSDCEKSSNYAACSWLNLHVGLPDENTRELGLPTTVPEDSTSGDTESSTNNETSMKATGIGSGDLISKTGDISSTAPMLSPVLEGKRSVAKTTREPKTPKTMLIPQQEAMGNLKKSSSCAGLLEHDTSDRVSLNSSSHSKSGNEISRHSTGRRGNRRISPKNSTHSPTRRRCKKDRAAVMGSLEKSLGGSMHFESDDLIPLVTPKQKAKRNVISNLKD